MALFGLHVSALVGIFGVTAAAVVALYVLKLRRRPVAVPFSPIWQRVLRDKDASELFSRLRNLLSLLLQLAMLLLLVLALGDPRPAAGSSQGQSIVVLVDTSASMQATDVAPSRIEQAKARVTELVQGLSGVDRMLIARMDATTVPLSTMTSSVSELTLAVTRLSPVDTRADLAAGLAFALDVLRGAKAPRVVVVSDGALDTEAAQRLALGKVDVRFVPIGKSGRNVAITEFSVRRYPLDASRYEVLLELTNTSDAPADVELTLLGDGNVVDVSRLALKAGETLPRFYPDLGGASRTLEARIRVEGGAPDALGADDRAYALMPERRRARVQVVTRGSTYLQAALLLDEYLDVSTVEPGEYRAGKGYDVTIFDGVAPPPPEAGGTLYLAPPAEGAPVGLGRALSDFGFDTWDRKSPVLRWMAVENIQVGKGHALVPKPSDKVLGASEGAPILVQGRRDGRPFIALGFDPRDSDLVLRVAWPLFVLNVIHSFVEDDTSYVAGLRTGEAWHVPVTARADKVRIRDPRGLEREVPVKDGRAVLFGERAGFYEIRAGDGAPTELFAANLSDPEESHIEPRKTLELGGRKASPPEPARMSPRREVWGLLLLLVLLVSVVEWFTYHRRITV